ncbi:MAG: 30S ribosomal protein S20 [Thermodesulfovibrionales bacterium]|nr:30S ribosomal protein S20 [Thermodesulfovibrionales bacterium]
MPAKKPKRNKSAMKRARQAKKREARNKAVKSTIKTLVKKVEASIAASNKEETAKNLKIAIKYIMKAAAKGVIHKNTAARKISKLTKKANTLLLTGQAA